MAKQGLLTPHSAPLPWAPGQAPRSWACSSQGWADPAREALRLVAGQQPGAGVPGLQSPTPKAVDSLGITPSCHYGKWALWAPAFPSCSKGTYMWGAYPVSTYVSQPACYGAHPCLPHIHPQCPTPAVTPPACSLLGPYPPHLQHHQPPDLLCTRSPRPAPSHGASLAPWIPCTPLACTPLTVHPPCAEWFLPVRTPPLEEKARSPQTRTVSGVHSDRREQRGGASPEREGPEQGLQCAGPSRQGEEVWVLGGD